MKRYSVIADSMEEDHEGEYVTYESAMTEIRQMKSVSLRDYFAGQATSGFLSANADMSFPNIAAEAYEVAEAMLKRRQHEMVLDIMDQCETGTLLSQPQPQQGTESAKANPIRSDN